MEITYFILLVWHWYRPRFTTRLPFQLSLPEVVTSDEEESPKEAEHEGFYVKDAVVPDVQEDTSFRRDHLAHPKNADGPPRTRKRGYTACGR